MVSAESPRLARTDAFDLLEHRRMVLPRLTIHRPEQLQRCPTSLAELLVFRDLRNDYMCERWTTLVRTSPIPHSPFAIRGALW